MLRHPFFGVIECEDRPHGAASLAEACEGQEIQQAAHPTQRRTFFAQALAGLFGAGALLMAGKGAEAQDSFKPGGAAGGSFDKGFSGQSKGSFRGGLGGDSFGDPGPRYNGGGGQVTTFALGEEGSRPPGGVTTYALGEEGSYRPPYRRYYYRRPRYTTYALGEEGGRW